MTAFVELFLDLHQEKVFSSTMPHKQRNTHIYHQFVRPKTTLNVIRRIQRNRHTKKHSWKYHSEKFFYQGKINLNLDEIIFKSYWILSVWHFQFYVFFVWCHFGNHWNNIINFKWKNWNIAMLQLHNCRFDEDASLPPSQNAHTYVCYK